MEYNVNFLNEYDKDLLIFAIEHYVEHVHPIVYVGSKTNEPTELPLINVVKSKVDASDFTFTEQELLKFSIMLDFFGTEVITYRVDSLQDESKIEPVHLTLNSLSRQLEDFFP